MHFRYISYYNDNQYQFILFKYFIIIIYFKIRTLFNNQNSLSQRFFESLLIIPFITSKFIYVFYL